MKIKKNLNEKFEIFNCKFVVPLTKSENKTIARIMLYNNQMNIIKSNIVDQIYILNKLYSKLISKQKQEFDKNISDFINSFDTQSNNKFIRILLNQQYNSILKKTNEFEECEKTVKMNIANFNNNLQLLNRFLESNQTIQQKVDLNALNIVFNQNIPCVKYCKNDVERKIKHINNLYAQTTNCESKGDKINEI